MSQQGRFIKDYCGFTRDSEENLIIKSEKSP